MIEQNKRETGEEWGSSYQDYLASDYWHSVADAVKARAGFRCQVCNSKDGLVAHHRTYENKGRELDHLDDLICLCGRCHTAFHRPKLVNGVMRPTRMPNRGGAKRVARSRRAMLQDAAKARPDAGAGMQMPSAGTDGVYATPLMIKYLCYRKPTQRYMRSIGFSFEKGWKQRIGGIWLPLNCFKPCGQKEARRLNLVVRCPV